jgi:hypothetical protein
VPRTLLVWILSGCLLLGGCSARQPAAVTAPVAAEGEPSGDLNRFCRQPVWIDNYPLLKGLVYASTLLALGAVGLHPCPRESSCP